MQVAELKSELLLYFVQTFDPSVLRAAILSHLAHYPVFYNG